MIAVAIASTGRPDTLRYVLECIQRQSRVPDAVFICCPNEIDFPSFYDLKLSIYHRLGPAGLTLQRNVLVDMMADYDYAIFIDDDFVPSPHFVENADRLMRDHPMVALATGVVLADGAKGEGISIPRAESILADFSDHYSTTVVSVGSAYGCNMVVNLGIVRQHALKFDENLPLYGWLEDMAFSKAISKYGEIVQSKALAGVHLAIKKGRVSGVRYGYSQIANPHYLFQLGLIPITTVASHAGRNLIANLVYLSKPEPYVDRRGRLLGNFMAIRDIISARCHPKKILEL